jgi:hypothetical protein
MDHIYRVALHILPRRFRTQYGDDMAASFRASLEDVATPNRLVRTRLLTVGIRDIVSTVSGRTRSSPIDRFGRNIHNRGEDGYEGFENFDSGVRDTECTPNRCGRVCSYPAFVAPNFRFAAAMCPRWHEREWI